MVKVDLSGTSAFFDPAELDFAAAAAAHRTLADKTGAVNHQRNRQLLHTHIMKDLVVASFATVSSRRYSPRHSAFAAAQRHS